MNRRGVQRFRQLAVTATGSAKIKILLFCCIAFTLLALPGWASKFMGWSNLSAPDDRLQAQGKGYAIVMNTWKRYDLLKQSIAHYASCSELDSIHIVWSEPDPPSDPLVAHLNRILQSKSRGPRQVELKFDINKEDSLNNRFKEIKDLKTDAVFSIDDDVVFPCSSVEFAFHVWQSAPDNLRDNNKYYSYGGWWSVWWTGTYSMVLSKAAFFHKKYLRLYTNEMPASLKDYITKNRNCEDIAMSFLVANATDAPPVWVKGKIFEIGSTGISSLGGHKDRRSLCINRFVAEFGRMPLVSTTVKAIDSRSSWFW
ncbi:unnamed protein product [Linum tenue]|uniref:Glycosyl transferase 64 domain-containing protein n=1 Tax=Linum tenue TaxID=586396 RepID=A0AAV0MA05_9ROSI|nr:unnamed protein product [Linum tenue]